MAGKVAPIPLSAVSMKKQAPADAPPPLPGVRHAIIWALLNAGHVAVTIACTLIMPSSWVRPRPRPAVVEMTDAEVEVAAALLVAMLCCVVSQAAAGVLALMVPRRRRRLRLVLAYAALVATAAGHSMWAVLLRMFVAEEGGLSFWTSLTAAVIFFLGVGDVLCFVGLVLLGGE